MAARNGIVEMIDKFKMNILPVLFLRKNVH